MPERDEEDLPILDAVVRGGDAAIIRSLRQGRETLAELEALRSAVLDIGAAEIDAVTLPGVASDTTADTAPDRTSESAPESTADSTPDTAPDGASGTGADPAADCRARGPVVRPGRGDGSPVYLDAETMRPRTTTRGGSIDVVLERHVDALRRELRELLCGVETRSDPRRL